MFWTNSIYVEELMKQYTNEFTAQIQASFNEPTFTPEQIASMAESARAIIAEQRETNRLHPVIGIYRFATVGSLTRRGGIVHETTYLTKSKHCPYSRSFDTADSE